MRLFLLFIFVINHAFAAYPLGFKGQSQSTPSYPVNVLSPYNSLTNTGSGNYLIETGNQNILINPSFANTSVSAGWTLTNASGAVTTDAIDGRGIVVTNSGSGGSICQNVNIQANQWQGTNFSVSSFIKTSNTDVSICSMVDGVEQSCALVSPVNTYARYTVNAVGGATSVGVCVKATSASSVYRLDGAFVGALDASFNVSQSGWFGSVRFAGIASCSWVGTGTGSLVAFSADTDCSTPIPTGYLKAPSTKIPAFVIPAGSPSGIYKVQIGGGTPFAASATGASLASCQWVLSDGTAHKPIGISYDNSAALTKSVSVPGFSVDYDYTSSGSDKTLDIRSLSPSSGGRTCVIDAGQTTYDLIFDVSFSPSASPSMYANRCSNLFNCEYEFSAYISAAGAVSGENLDWITGSVAVSDTSQYAITVNTSLGLANGLNCVVSTNGNNDTDLLAKLKSSTNTTVTYRTLTGATKVASDVYIKCSKVGSDYDSAKVNKIIGTFADVVTAPGTPNAQPKFCSFLFHGATTATACSSSPCTVSNAVGCSAVVTRSGTGGYSFTLSGVGYTNKPNCILSANELGTTNNYCNGGADSTTTGLGGCRTNGGSAVDESVTAMCFGY